MAYRKRLLNSRLDLIAAESDTSSGTSITIAKPESESPYKGCCIGKVHPVTLVATVATVAAVTAVLRQVVIDNVNKKKKRSGKTNLILDIREALGKNCHLISSYAAVFPFSSFLLFPWHKNHWD